MGPTPRSCLRSCRIGKLASHGALLAVPCALCCWRREPERIAASRRGSGLGWRSGGARARLLLEAKKARRHDTRLLFLSVDLSLYPHSFLSRGTSAGQRAAPPSEEASRSTLPRSITHRTTIPHITPPPSWLQPSPRWKHQKSPRATPGDPTSPQATPGDPDTDTRTHTHTQ